MHLGIYLWKNNKTNKQKKTKQKPGKKKERKEMSRTRTRNLWLVAILPDHYTTKADYVILPKSFLFNAFSTENPPANTIQDDRAA